MSAITEIRPNTFEEIIIGTQTWMKRNYDFGGMYPDGNFSSLTAYGKLYTWAEASAISVTGWRLPTITEVALLVAYLGGYSIAGGKLKEAGITHWTTPNTGADNSSGFTAVAAGYGIGLGLYGYFWNNAVDVNNAYYFRLDYNTAVISTASGPKTQTFSVRLIKG